VYNPFIMERMRDFSYSASEQKRERLSSRFEMLYGLDTSSFENQTGLQVDSLRRRIYSPTENTSRSTDSRERSFGEVLRSADKSTIVVPSPTSGKLTAAGLAEMSIPVVGYINQQQPDVVVGCDRGGRMYSLAVHAMHGEVRDAAQKFPTLDGKLHFARLSTSLETDVTAQALADILRVSVQEARRQGRGINGERPRIMFIDDWISSGATRRQINESLDRLGQADQVDVSFAVMCGSGADVSGGKLKAGVPWQDNPALIGVDYTKKGEPVAVRTEQSRKIRRDIHAATKRVAAALPRRVF
jgi:hypothetical protein